MRTSGDEEQLRDILSKVEITLTAHATDAVPQGSGNAASASGKHDLTSRVISGKDVDDFVTSENHIYAIWRPTLHLIRPQIRLQRPAVYFTAYMRISTEALVESKQKAAEYLESFEPLPENILEPLNFDLSFGDGDIYLSESLISKTAPPVGSLQDSVKPIRGASKRAFPIIPALFTRIKYSVLPDTLIASLHLEASRLITGTLTVHDVALDTPHATVENISPLNGPKATKAGDEIVLLYKIKRQTQSDAADSSSVFVHIETTLTLSSTSKIDLDTKWQTKVDLSSLSSRPVYKWSRPLSAGSQQAAGLSFRDAPPPSLPDVEPKVTTSEQGVIFNIIAPATISKDDDLELDIQCINRSDRPRRFALVTLPPKRNPTMDPSNEQMSKRSTEQSKRMSNTFIAEPTQTRRRLDVLDLNPDFRIGPLPPGAIFETKMKFRTLTMGSLDLGALRIVDLDTRRTVDVKDLPDVIVMPEALRTEEVVAEEMPQSE